MKKIVLACGVIVLALACGPLPQAEEVQSATVITAPDPMSVGCITGYQRVAPHICSVSTAAISFALPTVDNTCRSIAVSTFSYASTIKYVAISLTTTLHSNNAIAIRTGVMTFYGDSSCVGGVASFSSEQREFAATIAGTEIFQTTIFANVPVVGGNIYYKADSVSTSSTPSFIVGGNGYYD